MEFELTIKDLIYAIVITILLINGCSNKNTLNNINDQVKQEYEQIDNINNNIKEINKSIDGVYVQNKQLHNDNILLINQIDTYSHSIDSLYENSIHTLENNLDKDMVRLNENRNNSSYTFTVKDTILDNCIELNKQKDKVIEHKDTIIKKQNIINHNLEVKITNLDTVIEYKDNIITSKDSIISHKDTIITFKDEYIEDQKKVFKRKNIRTFINGALIGIGTGIGIVLLIK